MSTQFSWDTFFELLVTDPKRAAHYECEHSQLGWITRPAYEEGFSEGKRAGMAKALIWYLEKRFGAVPAALRERVFDADVETMDAWIDKAIGAQSLQALLEVN